MKSEYRLSVVIAVQYAQDNLAQILRMLDPARHSDVELLFCSTDTDTVERVDGYDNVRVLSAPRGSLIPHLWRDGIQAAKAEKVALSTAHCIPEVDWVDRLLAVDMSLLPGIGGIIANDDASDARGWAIYLLRYISFTPPQENRQVTEIAADNAVYRRADIIKYTDLLKKGFWEPSFHARFRQAGLSLSLDSTMRVIHSNRYTTGQFFRQRLAHGKEFGRTRASELSSFKRLLLIVLSPILPILFLSKIVRGVFQHGKYKLKLLQASPWLLLFLLAWGIGEAQGYLLAGHCTNKGNNG